MPSASDRTATAVKPGERRSVADVLPHGFEHGLPADLTHTVFDPGSAAQFHPKRRGDLTYLIVVKRRSSHADRLSRTTRLREFERPDLVAVQSEFFAVAVAVAAEIREEAVELSVVSKRTEQGVR